LNLSLFVFASLRLLSFHWLCFVSILFDFFLLCLLLVSLRLLSFPFYLRLTSSYLLYSQDKKMATLAVTAASVAMALEPLAAQAASTDSLNNMLYSFVAGGVVLAGLLGAVYGVSAFDKVNRS
jgi:hypothetical protein